MMTHLSTKDNLINNILKQARQSHKSHHQNALTLKRISYYKKYQAREIVKNCKQRPKVFHPQKMGVNPRGLKPQTL